MQKEVRYALTTHINIVDVAKLALRSVTTFNAGELAIVYWSEDRAKRALGETSALVEDTAVFSTVTERALRGGANAASTWRFAALTSAKDTCVTV